MNPIIDILFSVSWIVLLVIAIRQMARGWSTESSPSGVWTTQVKRPVHPEMVNVKPGEELMGVTFGKTSCDLESYKDLQARIEQLREELEDEDDDDGGDVVVRV